MTGVGFEVSHQFRQGQEMDRGPRFWPCELRHTCCVGVKKSTAFDENSCMLPLAD